MRGTKRAEARRSPLTRPRTGPEVATRDFPPATSSVTEARHWARRVAHHWGKSPDMVERVAFNVTELGTNAVIHARTPFRVALSREGEGVRIEVTDANRALPRGMRPPIDGTRGRGMALVQALSARTGVTTRSTRGKSVWALVEP